MKRREPGPGARRVGTPPASLWACEMTGAFCIPRPAASHLACGTERGAMLRHFCQIGESRDQVPDGLVRRLLRCGRGRWPVRFASLGPAASHLACRTGGRNADCGTSATSATAGTRCPTGWYQAACFVVDVRDGRCVLHHSGLPGHKLVWLETLSRPRIRPGRARNAARGTWQADRCGKLLEA